MIQETNPIGSTFKEGDVTLQVQEIAILTTCKGCWYANKKNYQGSCFSHRHACTSAGRRDRKQVIFRKVDE